MNYKCAPSKTYTEGSCLSYDGLQKLVRYYNDKYDDSIDHTLPKQILVDKLEDIFKDECPAGKHLCWLRTKFSEINDAELLSNTFRPEGPTEKYGWLSNFDIQNVIEQYHHIYKNFKFLGAVPYDFEELPFLGLRNINFEEYDNNGITKLGIVINLDEHYKGGSHWVSLFIDLENYRIYYFDSIGKPPGKRVRAFINRAVKYFYYKKNRENVKINRIYKMLESLKYNNHNINPELEDLMYYYDINYNNIQHQFDDSECGVYSINFILRLLEDEPFETIIKNPVLDEDMHKNRKIYFYNT